MRQVARMGERAGGSPATGISPVQQMLASGTGALLTSVFGKEWESTQQQPHEPDAKVLIYTFAYLLLRLYGKEMISDYF